MGAELHADALEVGDEFAGREVFAAVEGHVLEEMGEALLVVGLVDGAGADMDLDGHFAWRVVVLAIHPGHAVVEFAAQNAGVLRQRPGLGGHDKAGDEKKKSPQKTQISFHSRRGT